ncbi:MAG: hypothetical protein A3F84_19290 [Candidatus Handelsmanbacteria bacterium RIFCSPLOWO2_12_FULL_64_10]|uniref:Uncharacterized protein n=1 Tax=Handelsmanbacteria sp. (strain RIFCSPLOWO2_12_FULL_64_10) TaxID=1817868 RepID=A0A1F6CZI1_HANXR|nr:MAG: hypothetical protein A3F84_19290 [Candidatus Handelsmanbacteria bacterium RIFCSPLOWO2_12_FULL_64_10]
MSDQRKGLTLRAVGLGLLIVVLIDVWATYVELYSRASRLTMDHFPIALFAVLLVLLSLNSVLRKFRLSELSRSELLVILAIGFVGAKMPVDGVAGYLLGTISSFYYFATPENQWSEFYHPYLPAWLVPQGADAIWRHFFEGVGAERGIPWMMWALPLFWWATFIGATFWVSTCIIVVLRKQWVEHERLAFPLAAVASRMLADPGEEGGFPSLMRNLLFWVGIGISSILFFWQILSWFYPGLPLGDFFPWISQFQFWRGSRSVVINPFQFFTLGFAYFAPVEVLFSVWFFYLVNVGEGAIFSRIGYGLTEAGNDQYCSTPPSLAWQGLGAMGFMVLWGIWIARRHLKDVFRKAVDPGCEVDDSGEIISYRTAVWGGLLGLAYMFAWLHQSGMEYRTTLLFLTGSFIIYIGMARIVAESGVPYTWGSVSAQSFVMNALGTTGMSGYGMASLLLSYSLIDYVRGFLMPPMAHVARFGDMMGGGRRRLLLAVGVGAGVSLVASFIYTLGLAYSNGAYNTYGWPPFFGGDPKGVFSNTLSKVRNPFPTDWARILNAGAGAVAMGALTFLRSRLLWWRIHPIGFVTSSMINTNFLAVPFFIGWGVKSIILRMGGARLYRRGMPLFIGLMVGYVAGVCLCSVLDMLYFPAQGHVVHTW